MHKFLPVRYFLFLALVIAVVSCKQINVYEKQATFPQHEWSTKQSAVLKFDIADSIAHQLYFTVRHTQRYPFTKLLVKLTIQDSANHTLQSMFINAPLANTSGNWRGTKMDDVFYCRFKLNPRVFLKPGRYRFVLQHAMKEPIVTELLNVGIALDK